MKEIAEQEEFTVRSSQKPAVERGGRDRSNTQRDSRGLTHPFLA
jgi:hypothetical protein